MELMKFQGFAERVPSFNCTGQVTDAAHIEALQKSSNIYMIKTASENWWRNEYNSDVLISIPRLGYHASTLSYLV